MFEDVQDIVHACEEEGITVRIMADLYDMRISRMSLMRIGDLPLLTMEPVAIDESKMVIKSTIDLALSALFLLLLSPVMVIIALAIKLDSAGPVFFVQQRVGFHKRRFSMVKFRSMFDGSDLRIHDMEHLNEAAGPIFKIENDPRITRVGRFLRQTSLDELPQLFNILKGEMSLVGPRPMSVRDVELFDRGIQRKRFSVRPGLTCLWQVSGRSNLPFSKWLELDLEYIDNWNLFLDFKILLRTIPAVLSGNGAK
jgi:exopolysaccharide biosynthesis polyprenyl glycosylphosphotransferase